MSTKAVQSLSRSEARRLALAAQGFADRSHRNPTMRTLKRTVARTGVLQVDSVNVLARAHLLPLYSRMGCYDPSLLRRAAEQAPRKLVEYWAHAQALMPVELWPVMQHRMAHYRARRHKWWPEVTDELVKRVLTEVTARGASTARDLAGDPDAIRRREHWGWNWSDERKALAYLAMVGDLAIAGRNSQFEVIYDLPQRVLPASVLSLPTPSREEAIVELVRRAARSHGLGTVNCFADYYRLAVKDTAAALRTLQESGEVQPVSVEGWTRPVWLHSGSRLPRNLSCRALLAPFDPIVWERRRAEELFDFFYRIEIYVPAPQRVHGYYVLPFLLGDRLVGRVDLKADRAVSVLRVRSAWAETRLPEEAPEVLAAELGRLAEWLGMDGVVVEPRGDLAPALAGILTDR